MEKQKKVNIVYNSSNQMHYMWLEGCPEKAERYFIHAFDALVKLLDIEVVQRPYSDRESQLVMRADNMEIFARSFARGCMLSFIRYSDSAYERLGEKVSREEIAIIRRNEDREMIDGIWEKYENMFKNLPIYQNWYQEGRREAEKRFPKD